MLLNHYRLFLLMTLNEFTGDIRGALNNITLFLNLPNFPQNQILDIGRHYDRWFIPEEERSMLAETKAILDKFYQPFNSMLIELLGHDRKWAFGLS